MTADGTPDEAARRVVRLPVRDVSLTAAPMRARTASVTRLPDSAESAQVTRLPDSAESAQVTRLPDSAESAHAPAPIRIPEPTPRLGAAPTDGADDAVVALLSARLGFEAATAAAARVRLPSLADFLA